MIYIYIVYSIEYIVYTQGPGRIQQMDPPSGSMFYTMGDEGSRIGGCVFWILSGLWVGGAGEIPEDMGP